VAVSAPLAASVERADRPNEGLQYNIATGSSVIV